MAERQDIQLDRDELLIEDGDFVVGDSNYQQICHIMTAAPGSYKHAPMLGVNINSMLGANDLVHLERIIREQLTKERFSIKQVVIADCQNIDIDAE